MARSLLLACSVLAYLLNSAVQGALNPRQQAPNFTAHAVVNATFTKLSLSDYVGKYAILLFYPFDFTFVCPTELVAYSDSVASFRQAGAEVLAISTDSHHTHLAWVKTPRSAGGLGHINLPLVADISKKISSDYGVLVTDSQDDLFGAALRGIFIIDTKGIIRSTQVNDEAVGRNVAETLRLVKALQYADLHGEGCPVNWQPGDATVIPDPDASKTFFTKWSTAHKEEDDVDL
ncbi:hypothetical protein WJX72_004310 [[Myrmecia] bisecta]|uniref:Peroxiredoxin n=1 Tax=[Myrmecia] bisecta TaxID=41462 RepID=A0AAW1PKE0_9CHLO